MASCFFVAASTAAMSFPKLSCDTRRWFSFSHVSRIAAYKINITETTLVYELPCWSYISLRYSLLYKQCWVLQVWTIQMKAIMDYFPVVLFIVLYKMVLRFESVDENLKYDHSNKSYWAVLFCVVLCCGGSNFWDCEWMWREVATTQIKVTQQNFPVRLLFCTRSRWF